jgi:hypothetical protein
VMVSCRVVLFTNKLLTLRCHKGWIGNVIYNPDNIKYFAIYFSVTLSIVLVMFTRTRILKVVLYFLANTFLDRYMGKWIRSQGSFFLSACSLGQGTACVTDERL